MSFGGMVLHGTESKKVFFRGESIETIESLSQPDKLYSNLLNCAELEMKQGQKFEGQEEPIAVSEAMAELAEEILEMKKVDGHDDVTPAGHVVTSFSNRVGGDGSPQGSPKKIDSVEMITLDPMVKKPVSFSHSELVSEEANAELVVMMASLSNSMKRRQRGQPWCEFGGEDDRGLRE